MIKIPDYNGGFVSKGIEGRDIVIRDNNGYILSSQPINFIKKGLECKYGTIKEYSDNIVVLEKGSKTFRIDREELNNYFHKYFEVPEEEKISDLKIIGTFETEAGKIIAKGIDDSLRTIFTDPDRIIINKHSLSFYKSVNNKNYFAFIEKSEKDYLLKSIDVNENYKKILIKGVAATLKPPTVTAIGNAWNKKGGEKPGHKYIQRKPHPSGEGYVYLYQLPNGEKEWRDDNGKAIDKEGAEKEYSLEEFKAGDDVKMGDSIGRVEEVSDNFLAINFEGKVKVINKKDHIQKLKEHQLYKPGQTINTPKGEARILQLTDNLALVKRIDDNVLSVINLEKQINKIKKQEVRNHTQSKLNKFNYVNEGYAENEYEHQYRKEDYENTKEFQQFQDEATKSGLGDGDLERKKFVKLGNGIHTIKWKYDPNSKETIVFADGVKNHPLYFAGKKYFIKDMNNDGYVLDSSDEAGLFLSYNDYKDYAEQEDKDAIWKDAFDSVGSKVLTTPKRTYHVPGELSKDQQQRIDEEKAKSGGYKIRWKKREQKLQSEEEKAQVEKERQEGLTKIKEVLGSDAYKQFDDLAKERGFSINENKFNASKTLEIDGNKFTVQSYFDPETGVSTEVTGKYEDLELGDNFYPITDLTKDRVYYNENGSEKSISIDELKQINGKKVFEPTKESKGLISNNPATKFYFSPEEGDTASGFYEVIELKDLIASHKAGGEVNPKYSISDAQNRDRSKQQSKAQISRIATNPNFDLLSDNRTAQDGAPIVNEDYEIIAGNGRGIGIQEHYGQGGNKYKDDLVKNAKRLGFGAKDISQMNQPVLVRRINVDNKEAQRLGAKSNESNMLKTESREEAKGKATRIDDKTFNSISDIFKNAKGDYTSISDYLEDVGPDLVKKLSEKGIISDNEKHLYYDLETGKLNAAHKEKLKDLLTQSILGESSKHFERIPDAAREGITKGLGELFSIKGQAGDLVPHLQNAVKILEKYNTMKDKFSNPDEFISQDANNMLDPLKGSKEDLALFETLTSTKPNEIKNKFRDYVAKLEGDMFEPSKSPQEAFNEVFKPKYESGINKNPTNNTIAQTKEEKSKRVTLQRHTKNIPELTDENKTSINLLKDSGKNANEIAQELNLDKRKVQKHLYDREFLGKGIWQRLKIFGQRLIKSGNLQLLPSKKNPNVRRWQSMEFKDNKVYVENKDFGTLETTKRDKEFEINKLYLDKDKQRQGVGRKILEKIFKDNNDIDKIVVYPLGSSEPYWYRFAEKVRQDGYVEITRDSYQNGLNNKYFKPVEKKMPQTETEAFKKWFGNSKIVDENGKPLVVYHGTDKQFNEFQPKIYGTNKHQYYYFAKAKSWVNKFKGEEFFDDKEKFKIGKYYLSIQNPLDLTQLSFTPNQWMEYLSKEKIIIPESIIEKLDRDNYKKGSIGAWQLLRYDFGELRNAFIDAGYDGLIISDKIRGKMDNTVFVSFNPEQIKSAIGNDGNFDPSNPDITKSIKIFGKSLPIKNG